MEQEIQFCTTADNVRIAYASVGSGPPIVKAANWLNHLEYDWQGPVWKPLLEEFTQDHQLIRYDERGNGLSDWKADDLSLNAFVNDLEAVIDAVGVERFPLLGISQGGAVAIAYAARHPEKVSHLILFNSFATGWNKAGLPEELVEQRRAQAILIRSGWGQKNPAFRQLWTTLVLPDGTPDEVDWFNEMQRVSASSTNAGRIFEAIGDLDVAEHLPELDLPVLVLHCRGDATVPFEEGRRIASMIRGARFVPLESNNHLVMQREPAWPKLVGEIRRFLGRKVTGSKVKECPNCRRTYSDSDMVYCLDDGMRLKAFNVDGTDNHEEATQFLKTGSTGPRD